ncbi:hypothetical protein BU17DRAFT_67156 [Hysterangium stoloniferum]|nr:hypothetical protein BU17DRAFT_67156 [Hysterangium stoloniferum]
MMATIVENVALSFHAAFRFMVPKPAAQVNIDSTTWPNLLQPIFPLLCLAYLVERANTRLLRIHIFPLVLFTSLRSTFYYVWIGPQFTVFNLGKAYFIVTFCLLKAVDLAFYDDQTHRFCEFHKVETFSPTNEEAVKSPVGHVVESIKRAFYIICTARGVGLKYGETIRYPVEFRPLEKKPFLLATFRELIKNFLQVDLIDTIFKLTPGVNVLGGGSIFIASLSWPARYITATVYHLLAIHLIESSIKGTYYAFTLIGVGILSQPTHIWPPLFHPYPLFTSNSLREFWGTRWHQLLRRVLYTSGGYPGEWIAMRFGLPRIVMTVLGHGLNGRMLFSFTANAVCIAIEYQWGRATKRQAGGLWSYLFFVCVVIVFGAKPFSDQYFVRGLGGAILIPLAISPMRKIVVPASLYMGRVWGWL